MPLDLIPAQLGPGARGAFTTRAGGVSGGAYAAEDASGGLNLGGHVGDDPERVLANRDLLDRAVGARVAWANQVHGAQVLVVDDEPDPGRGALGDADVLLAVAGAARRPAVGVLVADCVPVLLATTDGSLTAAAHVGRQGLVRGALEAAVAAMTARGADPGDLWASIGPSICGRCYEVPARLREEVEALVPGTASSTSWGTPALDLAAGVRSRLAAAGVERVEQVGRCTHEDARFYSYRRDGVTGRTAGVVRARDTPRLVPGGTAALV
ncbi:polyphenol oxidase family protein [Georgenia faecalis]|uniref:Polyphenol oxidase family protein n=1 Tax=Georgenia faecalis TaxID=2483799 RepID=A0ABV9DEU3_9MICO|nr:polyphenol oxidase family protein [Georgenia faecalis]